MPGVDFAGTGIPGPGSPDEPIRWKRRDTKAAADLMAVAVAALDERRTVDTDILYTVAAYYWARPLTRDDSALSAAARLADTDSAVELLARVSALPQESPTGGPAADLSRNPHLRLELRLKTAARPAPGYAAASGKSKSPRSRRVSPGASTEPPSGFEPETYALRGGARSSRVALGGAVESRFP
ncbi:hypothetical protein [Streptomyces sioyaensis]|uniref:hypothetical protein n=1 Tax=Streptomyces sioyaensis TaxID=67364 RepID=UPI003789152C